MAGAPDFHEKADPNAAEISASGGGADRRGGTGRCDRSGSGLRAERQGVARNTRDRQWHVHDRAGAVSPACFRRHFFATPGRDPARFKDKRQAVLISQQIEADVSAYLVTITIMNVAGGVATGTLAAVCWLGDPVLWGTVAFLLNYVPILGPTIGVMTFAFAGLL